MQSAFKLNTYYTSAGIAAKILLLTAAITNFFIAILFKVTYYSFELSIAIFIFIGALVLSFPAFLVLLVVLSITKARKSPAQKLFILNAAIFSIAVFYGCLLIAARFLDSNMAVIFPHTNPFLVSILSLWLCAILGEILIIKKIYVFFFHDVSPQTYSSLITKAFYNLNLNTMDDQLQPVAQPNRIFAKGLVTGGLMLLMMVSTLFINNLIEERELRHKEVVKEVSGRWAGAQTLSAPFLTVPYTDTIVNSEGKAVLKKTLLLLLANDFKVNGTIVPEERPRSIYRVLLFRSTLDMRGNFNIKLPQDVDAAGIDFSKARLCLTLSDLKGIEEAIAINFNAVPFILSPGVPVNDFGSTGLSVPVNINASSLNIVIPFNLQVKLRASEQLHFMPLSSSSSFNISSSWPSPSFDGDMLPNERVVNEKGFSANWSFNQSNLPVAAVTKTDSANIKTTAFGISFVQPADQYDKTMRSVKYAILFIGLTFAFFFIIEIMQRKPFHPVQYILVGLALVLFYTLLLSISEYIIFNQAYFIAALAIVTLISLYAKAHFRSWKTTGIFFAMLSLLYGFIYVLISLEDTSLLVGSIGLFLILAIAMYITRKINWYAPAFIPPTLNEVNDEPNV